MKTKKDYIIAIRKILADCCLTDEAKRTINIKFPLERSPLWKRTLPELKKIYREYQHIYS
jgi:hypothetical protein